MKTIKDLYNSYDSKKKQNIKSHYIRYVNMNRDNGYSYVSFSEWVDSYTGLSNIFNLMSLKQAE